MTSNDYARGFIDALEYSFKMFERLSLKGVLKCDKCRFIEEMEKLSVFAKDREFEKLEKELGYFLP